MRNEAIRQRIASFPRWHYRFDLKGELTPIFEDRFANRHEQRKKYFFDPLVQLVGGSLAGKRVLDLGCNAGFWSLCAARAGCDYVLGIDGRQMHVDQANFVFEVEEVERDRYSFVAADVFEIDFREFGRFDIVLCLGLMYHVSKHMELMEKISEVNDDVLLIDTSLSKLPGSCFEVRRDQPDEPRSAVDHRLVMAPTWEAVRDLTQEFGYTMATLKPRFDSYEGARDYRRRRRAFLCAKRTDVSRVPAEIEHAPPEVLERPEERASSSPGKREGAEASRLEGWMRRTDLALSELFTSRRWKLANALGDTSRRVLRGDRGATAEDRLLAIRDEFHAWLEEPARNPAKRGLNRAAGRPKRPR
jgi:tRNA (mo5U34)-methyltransferase